MPNISPGEHQRIGSYPEPKELRVWRGGADWRGAAVFTVHQTGRMGHVLGGASPPALSAVPYWVAMELPANMDWTILNVGEVELTWDIAEPA